MVKRRAHQIMNATLLIVACVGLPLVASLVLNTFSEQVFADAKATGSLTVKIKPKDAKQDGARWRVDGGAWQKGGKTLNLDAGQHSVSYKDIPEWKSPKDENVEIISNEETATTGKYKHLKKKTVMLPGNVPLELVWCPAGSFQMGRYTNEQQSIANESPQHKVTFKHGFWIGKYEVTQEQWVAVMGSNPSHNTESVTLPVESVSWNTVQTFLTTANAKAQGVSLRLPSEAEWEYACRAGTQTRYYWGDDSSDTAIGDYAWYKGSFEAGFEETMPAGQLQPNAWGLFDTSGNVSEWCEDWMHDDYTGAPIDGSAWTSSQGTFPWRVLRGGNWHYFSYWCRSAFRDGTQPSVGGTDIGFRVAAD